MLDLLPSMASSLQHSTGRPSRKYLRFLALLCFVGTACSTTAPPGKILFDDPRGTVSLQTIPDRSIQASHPINLEPNLLAQVLKGIQVQDQGDHLIQRLLAGPSALASAFSDQQIQFLSPLLAEALRTASQDQQIEFLVYTSYEGSIFESSTTETTAGSLYAYGRQLFVTLSKYRYSPTRANINVRNINYQSTGLDYSGLKNRILLFTPKAAQRSDGFDPPPTGRPSDRFLAIDYELLQHTPNVTQTAPQLERAAPMRDSQAGASPSEAQTHSTEALAQEVETLRKELQSVQKQLGNQPTKPDSQKRKPAPQKK